jgi:hypothetical protein
MSRLPTFDKNGKEKVWIRPNFSLNPNRGEITWTGQGESVSDSPRILELADIALGFRKTPHRKTRITPMHDIDKTEPYNPR